MTFQILMKSEPSFLFRDCSRRFVWGQCLFFRTVVISCVSLGLIAFVCERSLLYAQQAQQQDPDTEFKKLDANGDKRISADEFKAFRPSRLMPDLFKRLDRDRDGLLSLVEFRVVATMGSKARDAGRSVENERLPTLSEPAIARGTTTELERYRAASEYSARHAGLCLLIMKDGEIVFEQHVEGSSPEKAYQLASGTKSFWGPIAQVAISEGLFTLDEVVSETLTEWKGDPRKSKITVRDLLSSPADWRLLGDSGLRRRRTYTSWFWNCPRLPNRVRSSLTARFISTRSANSSNASWRRSRKVRPRAESDLGTTLIAKF
jgi:hypothetical protein